MPSCINACEVKREELLKNVLFTYPLNFAGVCAFCNCTRVLLFTFLHLSDVEIHKISFVATFSCNTLLNDAEYHLANLLECP
jgi:hypothetical protein